MNILKLIICKSLKYSYKSNISLMNYQLTPEQQSTNLKEKLQENIKNLDLNQYLNTGDGPKFIGLLSASDPSNNEYWDILKLYWREKYFVRYTTDELVKQFIEYNFSGDQISGMLEAIWNRYSSVGLTQEEINMLISIWDNTLFSEPYYQFKHPYTTNVDRGWLLSKWGLGNEVLALLSFCAVGAKILKVSDNRYQTLFDEIVKEYGYLLECPDIAIWLGRIYGVAWYDEHSQMSLACTGYAASNNELFKKAGIFLANRYKHQPEIQAYSYKYFSTPLAPFIVDFLHLYNFYDKQIELTDNEQIKYFSLRSFNFQKMSKYILDPRFRKTNMYMWEEKDLVQGSGNKRATIDFIHLYSLVKDII